MNNTVKQIALVLSAALALGVGVTSAYAEDIGYIQAPTSGVVAKNPFGLCWRTGYWTPAMATLECDPDLVPKPAPAPAAPAPKAAPPAPAPAPAPAPKPAPAPVKEKVTMAADAHFDFDKSALKPEGKAKLDDLVGKLKAVNLEVVIAIGHTDSIGSNAYNQKLSLRRAASVKAYLVSKGIEANRIYTEGKGETQPVADNKTKEGRAKNRRVEIEVVGTRQR
ncbi:MAG: OmpA family protein [Betaproteobacteria bacterium]|nr:MAG: OmpA family protein [Betaproteobacteria bacterium]